MASGLRALCNGSELRAIISGVCQGRREAFLRRTKGRQILQACSGKLLLQALQREDFATPHARPILRRYRHQLLTFNDDIQGTSAVALGAILGAVNVTGKSVKEHDRVFLTKQEFLKIQGWRQS
jgi:hypothetical protein